MRLSRDKLIFRALLVLDDAVAACDAAPVPPRVGLRFAMMFLYAISDGERDSYDGFLRAIQDDQAGAHSEQIGRYIRSTAARTKMTGIARGVGVDLTAEYQARFRVASMPPEKRKAYREREAALVEHRRRLREDGWQYEADDRRKAER